MSETDDPPREDNGEQYEEDDTNSILDSAETVEAIAKAAIAVARLIRML